ncbi:hypothetical protein VTN00DRAFT_8668 [Thermoascus crustaceus]|uniref:uncharacterized protein n=1 Tax=Thermoascus crustaceus TaxID=5088 RepID=UPI0037435139
MSSLPIHLIYNSAAFPALATNQYPVVLASANTSFENAPSHSPDFENRFEKDMGINMSVFYSAMAQGKFKALTSKTVSIPLQLTSSLVKAQLCSSPAT